MTWAGGGNEASPGVGVYAKVAVVGALVVAIAVIAVLGSRILRLEARARAAEQMRSESLHDVDVARVSAQSLRDSLERALALLEPSEPAGTDSLPWSVVARNAQASASFWYEETQRVKRNQLMLLDDQEISTLKLKGLEDPARDIRADLMRRADLIPFEAVMGGRMQFIPSEIAVLSPQWVYARFEDGHKSGSCLLAFEVQPNGEIAWRRLAARED
jgi:hypothetical protein